MEERTCGNYVNGLEYSNKKNSNKHHCVQYITIIRPRKCIPGKVGPTVNPRSWAVVNNRWSRRNAGMPATSSMIVVVLPVAADNDDCGHRVEEATKSLVPSHLKPNAVGAAVASWLAAPWQPVYAFGYHELLFLFKFAFRKFTKRKREN